MKIKIKEFKHFEIVYLEEQISFFIKQNEIDRIINLSIQESVLLGKFRYRGFLIYEESE